MAAKQSKSKKTIKKTAKKARTPSRTKPATKSPPAAVFHKLHDDNERMLKIEWSDDHKGLAASPVSVAHAAQAARRANPPFCKNKLNDPTRKYYCEFNTDANQYICIEVDANDPRCG